MKTAEPIYAVAMMGLLGLMLNVNAAFGQASVLISEREPITVYKPSELNPINSRYEWEGATLLRDIRVIDGTGAAPVEGQDVLINDGKIAALGATGSVEVPADARVINGAGLTVLPGLIDSHAHLFAGWRGGNDNGNRPVYVKWQMLTYLYAGVTHIHDMGNNADMPSIGSTTQTNSFFSRALSSVLSSDSQP